MIVKKKDGWYVRSKKGSPLGGPYSSREGAEKRLRMRVRRKRMKK